MEKFLNEVIKIKVDGIVGVKEGTEVRRIKIDFLNTQPEIGGLIKSYYVFTGERHVEDTFGIEHPKDDDYGKFGLKIAEERYANNGNEVPKEDGIVIFNESRELIHDIKKYIHPIEKN